MTLDAVSGAEKDLGDGAFPADRSNFTNGAANCRIRHLRFTVNEAQSFGDAGECSRVFAKHTRPMCVAEWAQSWKRSNSEVSMRPVSRPILQLLQRLRPIISFDPVEAADSYTIGELSTHLRVSLRTLRFYEQSGFLRPAREGLKRIYSPEDLVRLEVIVTLRELEVSLQEIRELLDLLDTGGIDAGERAWTRVGEITMELVADNLARIGDLEAANRRLGTLIGSDLEAPAQRP